METIAFGKTSELKKNLSILEEKLSVKISVKGKLVSFEGEAMEEYIASIVLDALSFGFSVKKAITLTDPEFIFRKISIKDFTRRKDLKEVRARIIGSKGQTLRVLREISGAEIMLQDNTVGVIGNAEGIDSTVTAITNLIRGTKQSNVYHYLEKTNKTKKQTKYTTNKK